MNTLEFTALLERKVCGLTVLELSELLDSLEDHDNYRDKRSEPENIDLANLVEDLSVRQFMTVLIDSLPRGEPMP
jgi:hypothetical protein